MNQREIDDRRDQLAAQLRASGMAWQYRDATPERDHFRIWHRWRDGRTVIGLCATRTSMESHRRFEALYGVGSHGAACWWCYELPPGVEAPEPDGDA